MEKELRQQVKYLKCFQDISYLEMAEMLDVKPHSFYNWMNKSYEFSYETEQKLKKIINQLKEEKEKENDTV